MLQSMRLFIPLALVLTLASAQFAASNAFQYSFDCSPIRHVGCSGVFPARYDHSNKMQLLTGGEESFPARIKTLLAAKRSIRIQALIFTADESGLFIAEILKQKKAQGLDVRVIVDGFSNPSWATQIMYFDLKRHLIPVEGFEAVYLQWVNEVSVRDPLQPNKRFHDKMWIIDGEDLSSGSAIVGGMNIANEYFRVTTTSEKRWTDQDLYVQGPIVRDIVESFDRNFAYFTEIKNKLPINTNWTWSKFNKILNERQDVISKTLQGIDAALEAKILQWKTNEDLVEQVRQNYEKSKIFELHPISVPNARFIQSRPRHKELYIQQAYINLINSVPKGGKVRVANAYFAPTEEILSALKLAAMRGAHVSIITNSLETNDLPQLAYLSRSMYLDLLKVNEEIITRGNNGKMEIIEWIGPALGEGTMHAKFATFGDHDIIIGSYNLDERSAHLNSETVMAFESKTLAKQLNDIFDKYKLEQGRSIDLTQAKKYYKPISVKDRQNLELSLALKSML
mgnify:CR=1 FL=1